MTISKDKSSSPASPEHAKSKREISLEEKFQDCAAAWKRDTGHLSVEGEIASHEAYQSIIGMGEKSHTPDSERPYARTPPLVCRA